MNLKKSFSFYALISIYQALITFFSLSFFSHKMDIVIFGSYNLYLAIIPFLLNIMTLGTTSAIGLFYHKVSRNKFKLYISQIIFFILPFSLLFIILLYVCFSSFFVRIFQLDSITLFLLILLVFVQIFPQVLLSYYQTIQKADLFAKFNVLYLTFNFLFSIGAFLIYKDIYFVFLFMLFNALIFSFYILYSLQKYELLVFRFNILAIKDILKYGIPLVVHTSGITLLFMSDRFIISDLLGNESVGIYSVSLQLSMIMLILVNSFTSAWGGYLFKTMKDMKKNVNISFMQKIYLFMIIFLLMPLFLYFIQVIILNLFFSDDYKQSIDYVLIISFGYSMMGIYKIFIGFLHFEKKSTLISMLTFISFSVNIVVSYILVRKLGLIGASYGTLLSMFILSMSTIFFVNKYYKLNWRLK